MTYNERTVTLKLKRIEVCDILLALTHLKIEMEGRAEKWEKIHSKVKEILQDFDEQNADKI